MEGERPAREPGRARARRRVLQAVLHAKVDRDKADFAEQWAEMYRDIGYETFVTSVAEGKETHDSLAAIKDLLSKNVTVITGSSGVGKSSLLLRFCNDTFEELSPTIGVDFKLKYMDMAGKRLKLTVWDTAGQERFRTLTSAYYRGAQGIIFVYDITRRETFDALAEVWSKEVDMYSTVDECVKIVIGNKVDKAKGEREEGWVTREEGETFARESGSLFLECSAKTKVSVREAFEELVKGVMENPSLMEETANKDGVKLGAFRAQKGPCC